MIDRSVCLNLSTVLVKARLSADFFRSLVIRVIRGDEGSFRACSSCGLSYEIFDFLIQIPGDL